MGFFTSNALSTIVGQTGDWDVLVAGLLVAAIELLGAAASTVGTDVPAPEDAAPAAPAAPASGGAVRAGAVTGSASPQPALSLNDRLRSAMQLLNLWKAGIIFGLFTDAFKVGS